MEISEMMLCGEMVAIVRMMTKCVTALCGQNVECCNFKAGDNIKQSLDLTGLNKVKFVHLL
jgi:hypothetical protein